MARINYFTKTTFATNWNDKNGDINKKKQKNLITTRIKMSVLKKLIYVTQDIV